MSAAGWPASAPCGSAVDGARKLSAVGTLVSLSSLELTRFAGGEKQSLAAEDSKKLTGKDGLTSWSSRRTARREGRGGPCRGGGVVLELLLARWGGRGRAACGSCGCAFVRQGRGSARSGGGLSCSEFGFSAAMPNKRCGSQHTGRLVPSGGGVVVRPFVFRIERKGAGCCCAERFVAAAER